MTDWENWTQNIYDSITKGIKECHPTREAAEWEAYWEMLGHYRRYREGKAKEAQEKDDK